MKKIVPTGLSFKPRMTTEEASHLSSQIASNGVSSPFRVRQNSSSGYEPVLGARRLEVALAISATATVQDVDSGELIVRA